MTITRDHSATPKSKAYSIPWRYLIPISSIGVIYGYDMGASASASHFLQRDFQLSNEAFSTINSTVGIGLLIGSLSGGVIVNRLGRQKTLLLVAVMFTIFALGAALANGLIMLDGCRLMIGIGIGLSTIAAPVFMAEISPSEKRGGLVGLYQISNSMGILTAYLVGFLLSPLENWRIIFGLGALPAAIVTLLLLRLPDTAWWYLLKGRVQQAKDALKDLGFSSEETQLQIADITISLEQTTDKLPWKESLGRLLTPPYRRALFFVVGFGALAKLTGINALVYYQPLIFNDMGFTGMVGTLLIPGLITLFSSFSTLMALFLVDRAGRKPLMILGLTLMMLGDIVISCIFYTGTHSSWMLGVGLLGFAMFQAGFGMSFGSMIWVYSAESLPGKLRAVGATLALSSDFVINIFISQFFLTLLSLAGGTAIFVGFALMAFISIIFCIRLAPETKGRPLDDIQHYWEQGGRWSER